MRAKGVFGEGMQPSPWGVIVALLVLLMTSTAWAAPTVMSFQPSDGSVAPLSATVTATFSEAMNSRTITPGSFAVSRLVAFKAVAAGYRSTVALRKDGTVVQWGAHDRAVPAGLTDVTAIEVNGSLTYAVKRDGTVVSWGPTNYPVPAGLTGVVAVASGGNQTVALRNDGTVVVWGEARPATGDGCSGDVEPAVPAAEVLPAGLSGVRAIAVGYSHVVALKQDGTVVAWGFNEYGQTTVPAGLSGVVAVAAGAFHSVALKNDGTVVCWGENYSGQRNVPAGLTDVIAISAAGSTTVALKKDGTVVAWGYNGYGQTSVPAGLTGVVAVDTGGDHTVALKSDGTFVGWGNNGYGQAAVPPGLTGVVAIDARGSRAVALKGNGTVADGYYTNANLAGVVAVAAGYSHSIALRSDGSLLSWGNNYNGSATVPAGLAGVVAVDAGNHHNVALKNDGTVVAWGDSNYGKTAVPAGLVEVAAVAAGASHSVAVKRDGTVVAWGYPYSGVTAVPTGLSGVVAVAAGENHNLALKNNGTVVAWGDNSYGKATVPTGLSGVVAVAAGFSHSVAVKNDGTVVAWGSNYSGECAVPAGLSGVVAIAAGSGYTAALKEDGTVVSWGNAVTQGVGTLLAPNSPYESPVAGAVTYDETTRTAAFTPSAPLERGATYICAVNGARSSAGAMLADGVRWSFLTPELPVAQVTLEGLTQAYTGTARVVTATTTPPGLPVQITYEGITAAPTAEGSYNVVASIVVPNDQNYQGSASGVLNVNRQPIILGNLNHTYDGTPRSVTATSATGLAVTVTYNGSPTPPTGAGSYTVVATDTASNRVTGTLVIAKAPASMAIAGLQQTYDGTPKGVTLTRTPATLQVSVTYNGLAAPPSGAGSYSVVATCTDANYYAPQATATMVIAKAAATVSFFSLDPVYDGTPKVATATTSPAVPVSITYSGSATAPTAAGTYTVVATSNNPNYQLVNASVTMVIAKAVATVSFSSLNQVHDGTPKVVTATTTPAVPVSITYSGSATAPTAAGSYTVVATSNNSNYQLVNASAVLVVSEAPAPARTVPTAISFQPWDGSVAPFSATVTATFSEAMNSRSITPGSFTVSRYMGFKAVAAGTEKSVALRNDGTVVQWGAYEQTSAVPAGLTDVTAIEVNGELTYAVKGNGTVISWGPTNYPMPAGLTGIVDVASGGNQTVALRNDGTVVAWGEGRPGIYEGCGGETPPVPAAEVVPAGLSGVRAIDVGASHVVALKHDGTVVAWGGYNDYGQTSVPAGLSGVKAIAAGGTHSAALKNDGTVVCWGDNYSGQLNVPAGLTDVVAISAGSSNTVALKRDGTVVAWGGNGYGQSSVPAGLTGVVAVDAGSYHILALKSDGTFAGWGKNRYGQATAPSGLTGVVAIDAHGSRAVALKGDGAVADDLLRYAPSNSDWNYKYWKPAPADLTGVVKLATGTNHTVAVKNDGSLLSWGDNYSGAATLPAGLAGVAAIDAGSTHNVALKKDGTVVAWGNTSYGKCDVPAGLKDVVAVAAGGSWSVAVKKDGTVVTWGEGGILTTVPTGLSGVVAVAAGENHNLALKNNGTVVAWGYGSLGQTTVPTGLSGVVAVAAGSSHSVALKNDGTLVAWGGNASGECAVPAGLSGVVAVAAGAGYTAALKEDGTVVLWGKGLTQGAGALLAPNSPHESPVAGAVTYDATTRTATFTPSAPLERGSTYKAAVNGVRSSAGVLLADGVRWSFLTPELPVAQVTLDGLTQAYTGTPRVVTATTTPAGLPVRITYDGVTAAPTAEGSYNVVASIVVPNVQNYQGSAGGVLNVTRHPILLGNLNRTYDGTPKPVTATSTTGLAVTVTYNGSQTPPTGAGSYTVVATDTSSNYVTGTLVIAKAPASMAIAGLKQTYDGTPKAVTVMRTPATLQVSVTYNGLGVPPSGAGSYSVVATCTDANHYAPQASATMVTAKAVATVSFSSLNQVHDGTPKVVTATTTPGIPVSITYSGSATAPTAVGAYTVVATSNDPDYQLVNATAVLVVSEAPAPARAAPTVLLFHPSEGSVAPLSATVTATFSEAMNSRSITPGSFTVSRYIGFKEVAAGHEKTVALRKDGTVVQWGAYEQSSAVPAWLSGVTAIEVNGDLTYAVKGDGTVVSWGPTNYPMPAGLTGIVDVASGGQQTVALRNDGTVVAWGEGRPGIDEGCGGAPPVPAEEVVPAGLSGVKAIDVGASHVVALKHDGTVVAWGGNNDFGQTSVPAGLYGVKAIVAGGNHTAALKNDGTVVCWGDNYSGQLNVPAGLTGVVAISAGSSNTLALKSDGTVVAWGGNWYGQSSVPAGLTGVVAVDAGSYHTVALKSDGTFAGWGKNQYGQASAPSGLTGVVAIDANGSRAVALKGDGTVADGLLRYSPSISDWNYKYWKQAPANLAGVVKLAAGKSHTVALKKDGTLLTWGDNYSGAATLPAGLAGVAAIDAGSSHNVALKNDGTVVAWGNTNYGKCDVPAGLTDVVAVAAGGSWSVAVKKDGTVVTWGEGGTAMTVPTGLSGVVAVAAGDSHTLALKNNGTVAAWGSSTYVPTGLSGVVAIAAGSNRSVALKNDGTVVGWGAYDSAAPAGLSGVVAVAAGTNFSAALKADGTVISWGSDITRGIGSFLAPGSLYEKPLAGAVTYDETARTVTFTPSALLESGVTYIATVTTGVRSSVGNSLATDVGWKFLAGGGAVKGNQTIAVTKPAPAKTPCDSQFTVTAVASSGLPVTITASGSCSASNTSGTATIVIGNGSLGPCYLSYSQAGSALYNAAPTVGSTTELDMKKQVITFDPLPDKEYGNPPFTVNATASSAFAVSFSSSTPGVCKVTGNVVTIVGVGTCTITASQGGDPYCCAADPVTRSFYVGPGGLHHFAVLLDEPGAKVAGEAFGITIEARNVLDQMVTSYSGTVSLTTTAGKLTATGPAALTGGSWSGKVTVTGAGSGKTITATGENKSGTSSSFTVNPAAAVAFTVTAPTRATIGSGFTVGVTAKDIYNNVATGYLGTIHFTSSDPGAALPLDHQFEAADGGTHDFSVVLDTDGEQTVTATDTLDAGVDGVSAPIAVTNDANRRLRVTAPAAVKAGESFEISVTVVDLQGNQAYDYRGTVKLTDTDPLAQLADLTFSAADIGSKTFTATFYKAGNQWVTAVDSQTAVVRGTSGSIRVFPAAATKLDFLPQPRTTMAGKNIAPAVAVRVLDQYDNLITDSTAAVTLAIGSNPSGGALSGTLTRYAAGGIATFADLSINKKGSGYTLTAASDSLTGATSNLFDILAGPFHRFAISTIGPQTVATPFTITVTSQDVLGNTVTEFTESARLSISAGSSISPTSTGAFAGGVWSGPVTVNGGGTGRTVTATRTIGTETGVSNPFTVNKLSQTIRVEKPAPATAEDLSTFEVRATSSSGALVAITASGVCTGSGSGSAWITMTAGTGTCTVQYNQAGTPNYDPAPGVTNSTEATVIIKRDQAITIDIPAPPSAPCDGVFTVTATASSGLGVSITTSGSCTGSGTGSAVITVPRGTGTCTIHYDQPGNPYFNPAPRLSSTTTAHPLEQTITFGPLADKTIGDAPFEVSASATFDMPVYFTSLTQDVCTVSGNTATLVGVGTCTIKAAQEGDCCVATPVDQSFMVRPAAAAVLTVTAPSTAVAGVPFEVVVTAKDRYGNVATGYAGTVHVTSTDSNAMIILPPDFQFVPEDGGMRRLSGVVLMTAGSQTITATDTAAPAISGISGSIRINPAPGRAFRLTAPATATAGIPIDVVVTVEDIYQNVVTDYTGTMHLTSSDSQALLPADYTFVANDQGSKAVTLTLKSAGDQTVTAADTEISGTSGSIRVGHAIAAGLRFEQQPTTVTAGAMIHPAPSVKVIDQYGNFVADSSAPVTMALGNNPSSGTLSGSRTVNAVNGVATFGDLAVDMVGSGYTLTASSGDSSATSIAFDVTPGPSNYLFSGFLPPVDLGKPFKLGSTVPIKFQLTDVNGATVTSARACLELVRTSNEVMIGEPIQFAENKDAGYCFRVTEGVYIYNLDTTGLEIGTYHIHAVIDDTTTHMIGMALK